MLTITTTESRPLFFRALQGQNYSSTTRRTYGDDLAQFLAWVEKNRVDWHTPTRVSRMDSAGFMQSLAAHGRSGVTQVRKLAAIRKFFAFVAENNQNPPEKAHGNIPHFVLDPLLRALPPGRAGIPQSPSLGL